MEAWEALYRTMLTTFIRVSSSEPSMENVSHKAPNRRRSLETFTVKHTKRVSRDKKLVMTAMKKKIHFARK